MNGSRPSDAAVVIDARLPTPLLNWRELLHYRDLVFFLVWRDFKAQYAQSVLGVGWAIVQPVFQMVVFTVVFGNLAEIGSDGVPYAIFSFVALVPWTYFSSSLSASGTSLVTASNMPTKVYFPRLIIPIVPLLTKLVDFVIATAILGLFLLYYGIVPTGWVIVLPVLLVITILTAGGMGMWLTALSIRYRDVKYGMNFFVQLLIYMAPVVYPASVIPEQYRLVYGLFPMAGVIEGFRSALLATRPMPWDLILVGGLSSVVIAWVGLWYFRGLERDFADIV